MKLLDFERPIFEIERRLQELRKLIPQHPELEEEIRLLETQAQRIREKIYSNLTRWQIVQIARHPDRPHAHDYIERMTEDFMELHGDRYFGDDPAIIAGIGKIEGESVVIIAEEKGADTRDRIRRNFGMPNPEGYRKGERLMALAEKFKLPILTLVDTPGAYPGIGAEERGQARAIATSIARMLNTRTPIVTVILGEGGSGGALAIAVGDVVLALQYSIYSVISPEGCAAILWKDGKLADRAAEVLKLTAQDLLEFDVVDEVIPEPMGGAHWHPQEAIDRVKEAVLRHLQRLRQVPIPDLLTSRHERYLRYGVYRTSETP